MLSDVRINPADTGMGGLRTVEVIEARGLDGLTPTAISDALGNSLGPGWVLSEIDLNTKPGHRWASVYGTVGTLSYRESTVETDDGFLTEVTIEQFIPGDVPVNRAAVGGFRQRGLILRLEDNHGGRRLVGTLAQPVRLATVAYDTQKEVGGRRGTLITFTAQLTAQAPGLQ